jgi:hypothetical protein
MVHRAATAPLPAPLALLLPLLLLLAPRRAAAQVDCAALRTTWGVASDGKAIDPALYDVNWVGAFNSRRSDGNTYTGTGQNFISAAAFVQAALVQSINGAIVSIPTTLTYCPLNITAVNTTLEGGVNTTRFDIFWVVSTSTGGLPDRSVLRVQCLSLARLPNTATKNLQSWQTMEGGCPSVTPCTVSAPCTTAQYTAPLVAPAASGAGAAGVAAATASAAVAAFAIAAVLFE